ncbi:MAG: ATP-grasp domain-containing protein [Bacteroidota bacterium]|nr:ATP-grasp domain-containing protein [Bacteroidota bacterium]
MIKLKKSILNDYVYWVLAPHLITEDPDLNYYYDFDQSISEYTKVFDELKLTWQWQPIRLDNYKEIIYKIASSQNGKLPFVINLCDGDELNGVPGLSIIHELERYQILYTGADALFYEITTSKIPMKKAFDFHGVPTPIWEVISNKRKTSAAIFNKLGSSIILKPAVSGGSMGISIKNVVQSNEELERRVHEMRKGYHGWNLSAQGIIAEQYISGREFTTFVCGSYLNKENLKFYAPVERIFHESLTSTEKFLSFDRLWETYYEEPPMPDEGFFFQYAPVNSELKEALCQISLDAYVAVGGTGYGRLDIRMDESTGKLYVLEVNAQCGISEDENFTSIGAILKFSDESFTDLIKDIIVDTLIHKQIKRPSQKVNVAAL